MQQALAKLQKDLLLKEKSDYIKKEVDPWTVSADDVQEQPSSSSEKEKIEKSKIKTKDEKERHDIEVLESKIEAAEKLQKMKEDKIKEEMRAIKEQEEKRRANWARKMIDEGKSAGQVSDKEATKLEAQKLLKAREERLKQKQIEEEMARKQKEELDRKNEKLKEGIAQIVLPFQELITSPQTSTASPQAEHLASPQAEPKSSSPDPAAGESFLPINNCF